MFNNDVTASYSSEHGQNVHYIQEAVDAEDASEQDIE